MLLSLLVIICHVVMVKGQDSYSCKSFVLGTGTGLFFEPKPKPNARETCVKACIEKKRTRTSIKQVTVRSDTSRNDCWCYDGTTGIDKSSPFQTCELKLNATGSYECKFVNGTGKGSFDTPSSQIRGSCVNNCIEKKKSRFSINKVTVYSDTSKDGCWCYYGKTSISVSAYLTCELQIEPTVDGKWGEWTQWSVCSNTCGDGKRSRSRECNNPTPSNGGRQCSGDSNQSNNDCTKRACPVDGKWGKWTQWSVCSKTCGYGKRSRSRVCNNPPPSNKGRQCSGVNNEADNYCTKGACPVWSGWNGYGACSTTCGQGQQTRTRSCHNPKQFSSGCTGSTTTESRTCNPGACPVWAKWDTYGACSGTCGSGTSTRYRTCNNPRGLSPTCPGRRWESKTCSLGTTCPEWSSWKEAGSCTVTCGNGWQSMRRTCDNPDDLSYGCSGKSQDWHNCNHGACPVWTRWSDYGSCSTTCDNGNKTRTRICTNPDNLSPGCTGSTTTQARNCNLGACPEWSSWTRSGQCLRTCGKGSQHFVRQCNNPSHFRVGCPGGKDWESRPCNVGACPVWSSWSYTSCSVTCGGNGTRNASRICESTFFADDQKVCETGEGKRVRFHSIEQECTAALQCSEKKGAVVYMIGAGVAGLVIILLLALGIILCLKKRKKASGQHVPLYTTATYKKDNESEPAEGNYEPAVDIPIYQNVNNNPSETTPLYQNVDSLQSEATPLYQDVDSLPQSGGDIIYSDPGEGGGRVGNRVPVQPSHYAQAKVEGAYYPTFGTSHEEPLYTQPDDTEYEDVPNVLPPGESPGGQGDDELVYSDPGQGGGRVGYRLKVEPSNYAQAQSEGVYYPPLDCNSGEHLYTQPTYYESSADSIKSVPI